jgi:acyl-coenzyme A synthetase/AMP-(fatty) acid ligase
MKKRVTEILDEKATLFPNRIFLEDSLQSVSYKEVRNRAIEIAIQIANKKVTNSPIVIAIPRSIVAFEIMLAISYSNNYWVWIDTSLPETRQKVILEQLDKYIIISEKLLSIEEDENKYIFINHADCKPMIFNQSFKVNDEKTENKMAVVLTSGSTGLSKGVVISHEAMMRHAEIECEVLGNRLVSVTSVYSPFSICTISYFFSTMCFGGKYYILPEKCFFSPSRMKDSLIKAEIETIVGSPTSFDIMHEYKIFNDSCSLKTMIIGGAKLSIQKAKLYFNANPYVEILCAYGATELLGPAFIESVDRNNCNEVAVGIAYPSVIYEVIDDEGKRVVGDGKGELFIKTTFMADGYLNETVSTKRVFICNADNDEFTYKTGDVISIRNNRLFFEGRIDNQIKHLGYRVELEDVEQNIDAVEGVDEAVSVYEERRERIYAFYSGDIEETALGRCLMKKLPSYMRPYRCIRVEGKIEYINGKKNRLIFGEMVKRGDY